MLEMTIQLFNEDCMKVMAWYPDNHFDLAIVDPPYGIPQAFSGGFASKRKDKRARPFAMNMKGKTWDVAPKQEYFQELRRVSINQCIWGGNYFDLPPTRGIAAWVKPEQANGNHPVFSHFELCWTSFNKPAKVITLVATYGKEERKHPTQKPVKLYEWLLTNYAEPGQKILDTHLGSGSSAIAAHYFGVDFVGCEIDEEYFRDAKARIDRETCQIDMFSPNEAINQG